MKKLPLLFLIVFTLYVRLSAQEAPKVRFEKVSDEELSMKTYPNDTTAEAVILFDDGSSYVKYEPEQGFMLTFERFVRIKVLKQSGVNWGNFYISLYSNGNNRENLLQVKGTTINAENGKVVKAELKKESIFRERENKYWEAVRVSMPSVKVGSIIDLRYSIKTNLTWNLRSWKFQYTIPVKWSQYRVVYPEYYTYNHSWTGYHQLLYNRKSQMDETINYTDKVETRQSGSTAILTEKVSRNISYSTKIFEYAANDVPAIIAEPFLTALDNFTSQLKFELASVNFLQVGGKLESFTNTWNDIAKQLKEDENFGLLLKSDNFTDKIVPKLTAGITDNMEKLNVIYNHIQQTMKWDGFKSVYAQKSLKKAYTDRTGNASDINLLLTLFLNKAGISANPVILSTRPNGILSVSHPSLSDCNYVVTRAVVGDKAVLLDATEANLPAGFLPFRCLNGEGHMIFDETSEVVPLNNLRSNENTIVKLEIKDGKISGNIVVRKTGLNAFNFREGVKAAGGKKEYFDKLKNSSTDIDYLEYQYNKLDSLNQPLQLDYKISLREGVENDKEVLYIDPVVIGRQKDNPFTIPTREYPVDFGVSFTENYNLQLTIPEGYTVDELPQAKSVNMPNKSGQFLYQISRLENKIILNYRISIDKSVFLPAEYQALKAFYNTVINKEAEQIILKKTIL